MEWFSFFTAGILFEKPFRGFNLDLSNDIILITDVNKYSAVMKGAKYGVQGKG